MRPWSATSSQTVVTIRRSRRLVAVVMALSAVAAFAGTASAASSNHKLKFEDCYQADGSWGWVKTSDSPIDTNSKALHIVAPVDGCVDVYTKKSLKINKPVGDISNLSFDFREPPGGTVVGGAPRLSIVLDNGDVVFADAAGNCNNPIAVSGGSWGRADFTGALEGDGDCTIYLNGTVPYSNTATQSAWAVFAAANPTRVVVYDFFIVDQAGDYWVDRISLGTGKLYGQNNSPSGNCSSESAC